MFHCFVIWSAARWLAWASAATTCFECRPSTALARANTRRCQILCERRHTQRTWPPWRLPSLTCRKASASRWTSARAPLPLQSPSAVWCTAPHRSGCERSEATRQNCSLAVSTRSRWISTRNRNRTCRTHSWASTQWAHAISAITDSKWATLSAPLPAAAGSWHEVRFLVSY